jgi:hypothetical protein
VVVDVTSIARCTLGAIADPHANGDLFIGSVTAPIGFSTHTTSAVSRDPTEQLIARLLTVDFVAVE